MLIRRNVALTSNNDVDYYELVQCATQDPPIGNVFSVYTQGDGCISSWFTHDLHVHPLDLDSIT